MPVENSTTTQAAIASTTSSDEQNENARDDLETQRESEAASKAALKKQQSQSRSYPYPSNHHQQQPQQQQRFPMQRNYPYGPPLPSAMYHYPPSAAAYSQQPPPYGMIPPWQQQQQQQHRPYGPYSMPPYQQQHQPQPSPFALAEKQQASSSKRTIHESFREAPEEKKISKHRRDTSESSTASSLSVSGFSLGSYEGGPRVGAIVDHIMNDLSHSPKRRKADPRLVVDTNIRPPSSLSHSMETEKGFEQLTIEHLKAQPHSSSSSSSAGQDRNLFLSLSTSPINHDTDVTPVKKNTTKKPLRADFYRAPASIFKPKYGNGAQIDSKPTDSSLLSETPTPPAVDASISKDDENHTLLNRALRNHAYTPLPNASTEGQSPSAAAFGASIIAPQLSWSIAGDTPSLGDLAEWDDENKVKTGEQKSRPSSTLSVASRNMLISPHDFQFWKEDSEIVDSTMASRTTTPLPAFFGEENTGFATANNNHHANPNRQHSKSEQDYMHHMFMTTRGGGMRLSNGKPMHPGVAMWSKPPHGDPNMPPTPMFSGEFQNDGGFGPGSPMGADRRNMEFYHGHPQYHPHDRVRNLRGRMPMHMPPMPLHIPPTMSSHLPMTSPMGLGPKSSLWSPHHHGGMPMQLSSPHHHLGSPLSNMAQSKRKCVPLKPPVPGKFQGDIEKVRSASVPEFTSLVNFPAHMSQKQSINLPEGIRCCVMCGQACPCTMTTKSKKCKGGSESSHNPNEMSDKNNAGYAIIPTQNKGLCTLCDVNVWIVVNSGLEIKWCKGCKNFRPWAAFGDKGLATKCLRCRERQREKYALQKEEKEKQRVTVKVE